MDSFYVNLKNAIDTAFPEANPSVKRIIRRWYNNEDLSDFEDDEELSDYMIEDIEDMIDAADDEDEALEVSENLSKLGYI